MSAPSRDLEELLLCDGFVRALARELAADRHHAEDVAQEVWVAALERTPHPGLPLAAWIKAVVRNVSSTVRRGDARRVEREREVARPESVPSAAEILERESARRRVVETVLALEEPYRSTLLLRYFENLPPRAIAKRLGVPVETVRTRTKRGLDQLRARLDREYGGSRGAWCAVLAPMAHLPPAIPIAAGVGPGAATATKLAAWKGLFVAMSTQTKLGLTALALVALSLALFFSLRSDDSQTALAGDDAASVLASAVPEDPTLPLAEPVAPLDVPARTAVAAIERAEEAPPHDALGSLLVHVVWAADKQPASGIGARVYFWGEANPYFRAQTTYLTGADGSLRFERVRPQRVSVLLDRGGNEGAKVEAGAVCELTVEIPKGFDVQGEVVDEAGAPVADAEIWLCNLGSPDQGFLVARSSQRGEFAVRSIETGHCLGARAPGHAPSILQFLFSGESEKLRVRLALRGVGGAVAGRVLEEDGTPIAGAMVIVRDSGADRGDIRLDDGTSGHRFSAAVARTDERGAFQCEGLVAGESQVSARAAGFAPFTGAVLVVEHRTADFEARLCTGVRLAGTVAESDGRPANAVQVRVGNDYGLLEHSTWTAEDGSYVLEHLAPGEIVVDADGKDRGKARASLHGSSGSELAWNPHLVLGLQIFGRVVDEAGRPLARWQVTAESQEREADGKYDFDNAQSDEQGRFAFANCHDSEHKLAAIESLIFPSVVLRGVRPSGDEVVLRVLDSQRPSVRIVGTLVDTDGKPTAAASLCPSSSIWPSAPIVTPEAETGRIDLGPYPPGEWWINVRAPNHPELRRGPKQLAAGETWDLGTIQLEIGGRLGVRLRRESGVPAGNPALSLVCGGRASGAQFQFEGDEAHTDLLSPGEYLLLVSGAGVASTSVPFEIVAASEKRLDVTLRAGVECSLRVDVAESSDALHWAYGLIRDADGAFVHQLALYRRDDRPFETSLSLAPGDYRVEFTADGGRKAAGDLHVGELGSAGEKIVLTLR